MKPIAAIARFRSAAPTTLGRPPRLEWLPLRSLRVDETYQRPVLREGEANIKAIVAKFDWRKYAPLIVAPIGADTYAIVDGQHRAIAGATVGLDCVPCLIVDASAIEQAEIFDAVNGNITRVTWHARFKARLAAKDPEAVAVRDVAAASGVTLLLHNAATNLWTLGQTAAAPTVAALLKKYDSAIVTLALRALMAIVPKDPRLLRGRMIKSFVTVLAANPAWRAHPRLIAAVMDFPAVICFEDAVREAAAGGGRAAELFEADLAQHWAAALGARPAPPQKIATDAAKPAALAPVDGWLR